MDRSFWLGEPGRAKEVFILDILSRSETLSNPYKILIRDFDESRMYCMDDDGSITEKKVCDLASPLIESYDDLVEEIRNLGTGMLLTKMKRCVREYFLLMHRTIFFKGNPNLRNVQFRESEYLRELVLPEHADSRGCSILEAYNLEILLELANRLEECMREENEELRRVRIAMEYALAEKNSRRYVSLKKGTYLVSLDIENGVQTVKPVYEMSSISKMDKEVLLRKIQRAVMNYDGSGTYKIAVVGDITVDEARFVGTNLRDSMCENGLSDKFNVGLDFYVNSMGKSEIFALGWPASGSTVKARVHLVNYEKEFAYSTAGFLTIIRDADITFLLDTAFLFADNYDILRNDSMDYYGKKLGEYLEQGGEISLDGDGCGSLSHLNSQLMRMMGSRTLDSGKICWVVRSECMNEIKKEVDNSKKQKEVLLYVSDVFGAEMSGLATHPFGMEEYHLGEPTGFYYFSNKKMRSLLDEHKDSNESVRYEISMESLLSHVGVSLSKCVWWLEHEQSCMAGLSDKVGMSITAKPVGDGKFDIQCAAIEMPDADGEKAKLNWSCRRLMEGLVKILFCMDKDESDRNLMIRKSLATNMRDVAKSTKEMFFAYLYENKFQDVVRRVKIVTEKESSSSMGERRHIYADKKAFVEIPDRLSRSGETDLVAIAIISDACASNGKRGYNNYWTCALNMANCFLELCDWAGIEKGDMRYKFENWKKKATSMR